MGMKMKEPIELTALQYEVIHGALLGDGHLTKTDTKKKNSQFQYLSSSKQHVEYIAQFFDIDIKKNSVYDKRTDKEYTRYYFRTLINTTYTNIRNQWYESNIKILPKNLKLTPLICLIWYIGDGCLVSSKRTQYIKLSTHCFTLNEINNILLPQLLQFNATTVKVKDEQYYIYIPRMYIKDFLNYIGDCPFEDYKYKWDYIEYKNKQPSNHTGLSDEIIKLFKSGMTYYRVAKTLGIEPNAVRYYLEKEGLYKRKVGDTTR